MFTALVYPFAGAGLWRVALSAKMFSLGLSYWREYAAQGNGWRTRDFPEQLTKPKSPVK